MALNKTYLEIVGKLGLNVKADERSRDILDSMLSRRDWGMLENAIKGKEVVIFGCGPSLAEDLMKFKNLNLNATTIAVDGAAKAFMEQDLVPDIIVTDLDGDEESQVKFSEYGCITVVHAHGDNTSRQREVIPKLEGWVYGTTQVEPTEKIMNFGGFTDGDRAVYLAEHFKAGLIMLAGMDFGSEIGAYSGNKPDKERKLQKLAIGKRLIEELAAKSKTRILNLTSNGEEIKGAKKVKWTSL